MAFKELSPRLQLNFDEYVETWRSLITEYYAKGMDEDLTEDTLGLDEDGLARYSAELSTVILFLALNALASRKRISQEIRAKVEQAVIKSFYNALYQDDELTVEYVKFYHVKATLFSRLLSNAGAAEFNIRKNDIVGFARYLAAQVSEKPESGNLKAIEKLSAVLAEAAAVFSRLAAGSAPDAQLIGKTKFIVQK
ncbi:MAG TPA: hypothetical protein VN381_04115 [Anaerovoracaceae bacterium]|nr:hypothetical protein [Anaerovoracaceae bacterium]